MNEKGKERVKIKIRFERLERFERKDKREILAIIQKDSFVVMEICHMPGTPAVNCFYYLQIAYPANQLLFNKSKIAVRR